MNKVPATGSFIAKFAFVFRRERELNGGSLDQSPFDYKTSLELDCGEQDRDTVTPFDLTLKNSYEVPQCLRCYSGVIVRLLAGDRRSILIWTTWARRARSLTARHSIKFLEQVGFFRNGSLCDCETERSEQLS